VVTIFMTDAGLRGCDALIETRRGPLISCMTSEIEELGKRVAPQILWRSAGKACAATCAVNSDASVQNEPITDRHFRVLMQQTHCARPSRDMMLRSRKKHQHNQ
jgi:hypothetical protein